LLLIPGPTPQNQRKGYRSTTTKEPEMNTNTTTSPSIFRMFRYSVAVAAIVGGTVVTSTTPAFAEHGHDDGGSGRTQVSPYSVPCDALGGQTLAQYIEEHQAGNPRTFAGV
jgi:hypothetical protein